MKGWIKILVLLIVSWGAATSSHAQTVFDSTQRATFIHNDSLATKDSIATAIRRQDSTKAAAAAMIAAARRADSLRREDSIRQARIRAYKLKPKGPKPITRELSFGLRLTSNGWGIFADRGSIVTDDEKHRDMFYNIRLLQVDFSEIKNPKEIKSSDPSGSSSSFIYGKINDFYALNLGYGFRKMIAGKPDPGTVSIHWVGVVGLSLGLMKPYYIKAYYNGSLQEIKYSDDTKQAFLSMNNIAGKSSFSKGLGETKIAPGIHAKTGLHFDFSTNRKNVLGLETGINGELYTQKIPIMANQKAVPYFVNLYISFQFGKRW